MQLQRANAAAVFSPPGSYQVVARHADAALAAAALAPPPPSPSPRPSPALAIRRRHHHRRHHRRRHHHSLREETDHTWLVVVVTLAYIGEAKYPALECKVVHPVHLVCHLL